MKLLGQIILASAISLGAFASGIFVVAVPVPAFYLFIVKGRVAGWRSVLLSVFATASLYLFGAFSANSALYFLWLLLFSVLLGEGANRKWKTFKLGVISVITAFLTAGAVFVLLEFVFNVPLISEIKENVNIIAAQAMEMQGNSLMSKEMLYFKEHLNEFADFGIRCLPSVLFLYALLITTVSIMAMRRFISYLKEAGQFPFWLVWAAIAFGGFYFVDAYFVHNEALKFFALNGIIACAGLYFLQGLLLIAFWLSRKKRSPLARLVVYGLIIAFLQMVSVFIIALGLTDHWLDLRKRMLQKGLDARL